MTDEAPEGTAKDAREVEDREHPVTLVRGAIELVATTTAAVTTAIERVHLASSDRAFAILEALPGVDAPAKAVHVIHDAIAAVSYGSVRGVSNVVAAVSRWRPRPRPAPGAPDTRDPALH